MCIRLPSRCLCALAALLVALAAPPAEARGGFGFSFGFGGGRYYRPHPYFYQPFYAPVIYHDYGYRRPPRRTPSRKQRAAAGDFLMEPVGRDQIKLAWQEGGARVAQVTFFTERHGHERLDALTIRESPFAATLPIPPPDGFVGVAVVFADGTEVTKRAPLKKMLRAFDPEDATPDRPSY